jgi:hypothetical protein
MQRAVGNAIASSGLVGSDARLASEAREVPPALGDSGADEEGASADTARSASSRAVATGLFPRPLDWQPPPALAPPAHEHSPTAASARAHRSDEQHSERVQPAAHSPSKSAHLGVKWLAQDIEHRKPLPAEIAATLLADLVAAGVDMRGRTAEAREVAGLTQARSAGDEDVSALERRVERELLRASARAREKAGFEAAAGGGGGVLRRLSPPRARGAVRGAVHATSPNKSPTKARAGHPHALPIAAGASGGPMPAQRAIELQVSRAEAHVVERALRELVAQVPPPLF